MPRKKHHLFSSIRNEQFCQRQDGTTDQLHDIYHALIFLGINPKQLPSLHGLKEDKGPYVAFLSSSLPQTKDQFSALKDTEMKNFAICVANLFGAYDAADLIKQF